jgi:uncharacterized membrane protein (DUF373 family)
LLALGFARTSSNASCGQGRWSGLVTTVLTVMMSIVVVLSVLGLGRALVVDLMTPPYLLLARDQLFDVFGVFLLVLIGVELLETLRAYEHGREVRAEVIVLVAVIALARKIVTLDVKSISSGTLLGLAATLVALAVAFFCIRKTH